MFQNFFSGTYCYFQTLSKPPRELGSCYNATPFSLQKGLNEGGGGIAFVHILREPLFVSWTQRNKNSLPLAPFCSGWLVPRGNCQFPFLLRSLPPFSFSIPSLPLVKKSGWRAFLSAGCEFFVLMAAVGFGFLFPKSTGGFGWVKVEFQFSIVDIGLC